MSRGNRIGSRRQGLMTGRGKGWCGGANAFFDDVPSGGSGLGMGRGGGGRGWRHRKLEQVLSELKSRIQELYRSTADAVTTTEKADL